MLVKCVSGWLSDGDVFDVAYDLHKQTLVGFGSKRTLRTVGIPVSDRQNYKDTRHPAEDCAPDETTRQKVVH